VSQSTSSDPIIVLDNIQLTLGSEAGPVNILRGVDLTINPGETVSVVGPSGSGKTTMMMICAGLERPSAGSVTVDGVALGAMNEDQLALFRRRTIGIVFQNFHLVPTMTALENVAAPCEFARMNDAFARAEAGLEAVGLAHRLTHYPGQLSGGEQQRVALARAFAAGPKLILADEPTGNLDRGTGEKVMDLMFGLAEQHATTLMLITHDANVGARCAREVRMADGRIAESVA
jgi:putative ABC transport system ATP-binding protein